MTISKTSIFTVPVAALRQQHRRPFTEYAVLHSSLLPWLKTVLSPASQRPRLEMQGTPELRDRIGFTRLTLLAFAALDLVFKFVCVTGYITLFEHGSPHPLRHSIGRAVAVAVPVVGVWFLSLVLLSRPIERWHALERTGTVSNEAILQANRALRSLPRRMAAMWVLEWVSYFTVLIYTNEQAPSNTAAFFFLATMVTGPILIGHSVVVWLSAPTVRRLSLTAREHGVVIASPAITLRAWLTFYSVCLGLAPSTYTASIAICARAQMLPERTLLLSVLIFVGAVVIFSTVSAILLAVTITEPLSAMGQIMRAIVNQGDVSRVGRVPVYQHDELGAVSGLTNEMLDRLEATEEKRSAATSSVESLNRTLERRVDERTEQLSRRTSDMRLVLDNVAEGLFIIDGRGLIASEHSARLEEWFGPPSAGTPFHEYLGRVAPEFGMMTQCCWEQVVDGLLPTEVAIDQMPKTLEALGRHYEIVYRALGDSHEQGLLVVVSDVTARLEQEAAQLDGKEAFALFQRVSSDRSSARAFLEEGTALVALLFHGNGDLAEVKRAIHTLKGNAPLFGLESVARICHELESTIEDTGRLPEQPELVKLETRWSRLATDAAQWFGERGHVLEMTHERHAALERAVREGADREKVLDMIRQMKLEPVERRLAHFADHARRIAARLEKDVVVDVAHDGLCLDAKRWSKVWSALVHAVRNAVDHGIEQRDVRVAAGKPAYGRITLRAAQEGRDATVEIEDDGGGIPWERVRARATALGLGASTEEDLVAAVFAEGLSTAERVSDVSGRGVGMGALRAAVLALGGSIDVASERGRGTRLRLRVPAALGTGAPSE